MRAEYLKTKDACIYLGVSRGTFNKYILENLKMYFVGKEPRYKRSDLDEAMEVTVREVKTL